MNKISLIVLKDRLRNALRCLRGRPIGCIEYGVSLHRCSECEKEVPEVLVVSCVNKIQPDVIGRIHKSLVEQLATGVVVLPAGFFFCRAIPKNTEIRVEVDQK